MPSSSASFIMEMSIFGRKVQPTFLNRSSFKILTFAVRLHHTYHHFYRQSIRGACHAWPIKINSKANLKGSVIVSSFLHSNCRVEEEIDLSKSIETLKISIIEKETLIFLTFQSQFLVFRATMRTISLWKNSKYRCSTNPFAHYCALCFYIM